MFKTCLDTDVHHPDQSGVLSRPDATDAKTSGRPVRIASVGFKPVASLAEVIKRVDEAGAPGTDIIVLPESPRGQNETSGEPLLGATVMAMATLARKHQSYILCPIDRIESGRRLNSLVLLDRSGSVVCAYDKVFPYWDEFDLRPSVAPGNTIEVHQADFGRVGFATCFDVNFPEVWRGLAEKGAELVLWSSAYSAGLSLQAPRYQPSLLHCYLYADAGLHCL